MKRLLGGGGGAPVDWLIVGLGNPGAEYARSRHNVGFRTLQRLAERWELKWGKDRFKAHLAEGRPPLWALPEGAERPQVALLCPQTFYNDAGRSVGPARGSFKLPLDRVLVVHDEIDLPFDEIRTRLGGGLAGNNGLKSIKRELGGDGFLRVRVGVGRPDSTDPEIVAAYVLSRFAEPEDRVRALVEGACDAVERAVTGEAGEAVVAE
ncbi:MAG TPA: aminoacyl-tRNA hydrolase [Solirubrobacteraceae bacterium]